MSADPKFSAALYHEPTDTPEPTPTLVSRSLFDRLAHTFGASRVEADDVFQYVVLNERSYKSPLSVGGAL